MQIRDAQRQVRTTYLGGLVGQAVSAAVWAAAALAASLGSLRLGAVTLVVAGFFIFPLTQLVLRLAGCPASLPPDNPLRELAIEVALIAPLLLPLAAAAAVHRLEWFFPAFLVGVGAHYLPFAFLYGMRHFLALGTALILLGLGIGVYAPRSTIAGAWAASGLLLAFGIVGWRAVSREADGAA